MNKHVLLDKLLDETITVCDKCLRASCFNGIFMCDDAQGAGIVEKTRRELVALGAENTDYMCSDGVDMVSMCATAQPQEIKGRAENSPASPAQHAQPAIRLLYERWIEEECSDTGEASDIEAFVAWADELQASAQ